VVEFETEDTYEVSSEVVVRGELGKGGSSADLVKRFFPRILKRLGAGGMGREEVDEAMDEASLCVGVWKVWKLKGVEAAVVEEEKVAEEKDVEGEEEATSVGETVEKAKNVLEEIQKEIEGR